MTLIADSGSTKTMWSLIGEYDETAICNTAGINPFFLNTEEILQVLTSGFSLSREKISSVFFYGAGCALPGKKQTVHDALSTFFRAGFIEVNSDLLGAARSLCRDKPGIACILGTGSNSCLYDGRKIVSNVPPLGFILGDEGSGAVLGKKLLSGVLKGQIDRTIRDDFFNTYHITVDDILENTYRQSCPNRFLAQYTPFIARHIGHPDIDRMVTGSFLDFFQCNVMQYANVQHFNINFTGSVAFVFRNQLEKAAAVFGLNVEKIFQNPMQGLKDYHTNSHPVN